MKTTSTQRLIFEIENTVIGNKWQQLRNTMLDIAREQIIEAFNEGRLISNNHIDDGEQYFKENYSE